MFYILLVYFFALGSAIGSFLNVLIYRLPLKLNPAKGRSFCPNCNTGLKWNDLIPLFSFLFLKGRCRYCKKKISMQYFIIELLTGVLFALIYIKYGFSYDGFYYFLIVSVLITLVVIDYKTLKILNALLVIILISSAFYLLFYKMLNPKMLLLMMLMFSAPYIIACVLAKIVGINTLGMGDLKLAFTLGMGIQYSDVFYIYSISLLLILVKIALFFIKKRNKHQEKFAFSDVISVAYVIYILS